MRSSRNPVPSKMSTTAAAETRVSLDAVQTLARVLGEPTFTPPTATPDQIHAMWKLLQGLPECNEPPPKLCCSSLPTPPGSKPVGHCMVLWARIPCGCFPVLVDWRDRGTETTVPFSMNPTHAVICVRMENGDLLDLLQRTKDLPPDGPIPSSTLPPFSHVYAYSRNCLLARPDHTPPPRMRRAWEKVIRQIRDLSLDFIEEIPLRSPETHLFEETWPKCLLSEHLPIHFLAPIVYKTIPSKLR